MSVCVYFGVIRLVFTLRLWVAGSDTMSACYYAQFELNDGVPVAQVRLVTYVLAWVCVARTAALSSHSLWVLRRRVSQQPSTA